MANKITNTFILNITATDDASGAVPINRGATNVFDGLTASLSEYGSVNGPVVLANGGTYYQVYIKNVDPTNAITVIVTPTGGAAATIGQFKPGEFCLLCSASQAAGGGWGQITINAASPTLVEWFLGS